MIDRVTNLLGHHIGVFAYHAQSNLECFDELVVGYGPEFKLFVKNTFKELLENPKHDVMVIRGLDHICNSNNPPCSRIAATYGLSSGSATNPPVNSSPGATPGAQPVGLGGIIRSVARKIFG